MSILRTCSQSLGPRIASEFSLGRRTGNTVRSSYTISYSLKDMWPALLGSDIARGSGGTYIGGRLAYLEQFPTKRTEWIARRVFVAKWTTDRGVEEEE